MEQYRNAFDQIRASQDFQDRLILAMEGERTALGKTNPAPGAFPARRPRFRYGRWAAAAAILLAVTALLFHPAVTRAIENWFNDVLRAERYMRTERSPEDTDPYMEAAIQRPGLEHQSYEILLLDEIPPTKSYSLESINTVRRELGFADFSREEWSWLEEITPRVEEVLYDGKNLIFNLFYETDPVPFARGYVVPYGPGELACDILSFGHSLTVNGEDYSCGADSSGLDFSKWYPLAEQPGFSVEQIREDGGVHAQVAMDFPEAPGLPDGICEVELTMRVQDAQIDDLSIIGMVAQVIHRFSFDTSTANALLEAQTGAPVSLSGEAPVVIFHHGELLEDPDPNAYTKAYDIRGNRIEPDGEQWIAQEVVDFSALSMVPRITKRTTGITIQLDYILPESWDYDLQNGMLFSLEYALVVDGVEQENCRASGHILSPCLEVALTDEELQQVKEIYLQPYTNYYANWDSVVRGERMNLDSPTASEQEELLNTAFDRFDLPCTIPIPLD